MKVCLYTEKMKAVSKSGLGKSIKHQMKALELSKVDYTLNLEDDFDIFHINTYFLKSYFIVKKLKKQGKKIVYHAHSTEEDFRNSFIFSNLLSKLFKKWLIKCYSLADVIITPTPYSKKILEGYGLKPKIHAISNGIEIDFFKQDKELGKKWRRDYNLSSSDKVIIGIGLYIERKGILDFVELAKRFPEYKFIWFGYSNLMLSPKKIKDAINTKLDNLFFPGYVSSDIIKGAMNGCDLYLFPTLEETEGIPIIEACACKTNAIIRDIKIFDDWLIDGVNAHKAKDLEDFENKIKLFFNNKLKDVREEAYKVAESRDLKKIGLELKKLYNSIK